MRPITGINENFTTRAQTPPESHPYRPTPLFGRSAGCSYPTPYRVPQGFERCETTPRYSPSGLPKMLGSQWSQAERRRTGSPCGR